MRVGLVSDTHDNLRNVRGAVEIFRREEVTRLLHCGDVCGAAVVEALEGFTVHFAQGNMDRMPALGLAVEALQGSGHLARSYSLVLDGRRVALLHGDDEGLLRHLIHSGQYAYVFHGHVHRQGDRRIGPTRVINPGALGGLRRGPRSICILDLRTGQARFIEIAEKAEGG
ncbi:MAG: metallophosphoesterase family protein [Anaerolineae bacterium]|jgi:putative phosphoesterase